MNTRNEEYKALCCALDAMPLPLEDTLLRAQQRRTQKKRRKAIFGVPVGTICTVFCMFILLVNTFPSVAYACGKIPSLRALAQAVCWSPSLSAAVENQYVQPIELTKTQDGITATIEYVIVDQKQVHVFYTLQSDDYEEVAATPDFAEHQRYSCSISYGSFGIKNGDLCSFTFDFMEDTVPNELSITLEIYDNAPSQIAPDEETSDSMFFPTQYDGPPILTTMQFNLTFDPFYTAKGETIAIDQSLVIDGQTLTVDSIERYPTHMRLNVTEDESNTAKLDGMQFYLTNEDGETFDPIRNGVTRSGTENRYTNQYYMESAFFSDSESLTLHITETYWLDKDKERLHFNLKTLESDFMPEGVTFVSATDETEGYLLKFHAHCLRVKVHHCPFAWIYYDNDGNEYEINSSATTMDENDENAFFIELPLPGYHQDEVWLTPQFTHIYKSQPEVVMVLQ